MKSRCGPPEPQAAWRGGNGRAGAYLLVVLGLLGGCGNEAGRQVDPVAWWHNLEGGPIAAQRPPPPGADDPYPNLALVPPKPAPIDPKMRVELSAELAADRADAKYEAKLDPLVAAPAPAKAANGLFAGAAPLPAADPDAAGAQMDAVGQTDTPAAPATPAGKPGGKAAPAQVAAAQPVLDDKPIPDAPSVNSPMPEIPDAPPVPPTLPGVSIPVTVPHLPPKAPPPAPPTLAALTAQQMAPVPVGFATGSAILPLTQVGPLNALAQRRGPHDIEIVGFGDTDGSDPQSQLEGVQLALARARAIAVTLESAGVPMAALHMAGNAPGRGGAARLID